MKPKSWPKAGSGPAAACKSACNNWPTPTARFSPHSQRRLVHRHAYRFHLDTGAGRVEVRAWHGQDPADGHWGCPLRERWGLAPRQRLSPQWQQHLAFTLTVTTSYEGAAQLLRQLGHRADDSTLHRLAQRLGARAEAQTQERLQQPPQEHEPQRAGSEVGVLMLDGWLVRQRGPGWGKKRTAQARVEWHELKTGVSYRLEEAARKNGRGQLADKVVVSWQGTPLEFGQRLHLAACEHGLSRAQNKLVVGDGAKWIWQVSQDRWPGAQELLDFYHASQHLWTMGEALHGSRPAAGGWVEKQLHGLRHGRPAVVLQTMARLKAGRGGRGKNLRREQNYFAEQAGRMNYRAVAARGWPIGSGPVESACLQRQGRCKRSGQSWTAPGLRHLCALMDARQNHHWDSLWPQ